MNVKKEVKKKKQRTANERRKRIEDAKNLWRDITLASLGSRAISMVGVKNFQRINNVKNERNNGYFLF